MSKKNQHVPAGVPVLLNNGTVEKLPRPKAQELIDSGLAKRFVSHTIYRAMKLGIEVKNFNTRDEDGKLRAQIRKLREAAQQNKKN